MTEPSPMPSPAPSARKQFLIVMLSTVVIVPAVLFSGIGLIFFAEKTWGIAWTFEQSLHYLLCMVMTMLLPWIPYFFNKAEQRQQGNTTPISLIKTPHNRHLTIGFNALFMAMLLLIYLPYANTLGYYAFFNGLSHGLRGMLALNVLLHVVVFLAIIGLGLRLQKYRVFAFIFRHDQLMGSCIASFLVCSFLLLSIDIALMATLA